MSPGLAGTTGNGLALKLIRYSDRDCILFNAAHSCGALDWARRRSCLRRQRMGQVEKQPRREQHDQDGQGDVDPGTGPWVRLVIVYLPRVAGEPARRDQDHDDAHDDQNQAGDMTELATGDVDLVSDRFGRHEGKKEIEPLDQKAERDHRDRCPHPGQEGPLIRGMVAEIADHSILANDGVA